ncbi:Elongation factor Tu GTP binding domain containing protein [Planoprotostelium fungivorum]|uniref:Elongation factor 2 n=1 Tax=Planoprotostelium fungivorum TaxID=1890364 RepID=A0A2P6NA89_9EUKA|nr:Elongation factor Tu GTP binding domain containing protein [Planoprotostelium fungivorum]
MPAISGTVLSSLQYNTTNIRNICILAHVDHGMIITSPSSQWAQGKQLWKVRYLDNRPDEIARKITMKSSCISLLYQEKSLLELADGQVSVEEARKRSYLINLIDSPGHVDFSGEVSTAVRVCDGALVVVDAVEGEEPCLVINKIDRLITELNLTPVEAYEHLKRVLEQVNIIVGTLFSTEWFKELEEKASELESEGVIDFEEREEEKVYFSPEKGNVVFASAFDGWAFRIDDFCELYAKKLGVKSSTLQKTLWGDYYFNPKTKKIHQKNTTGKLPPMFVAFALNNIWEVYNAANNQDIPKREKICSALKLNVPPRELNSNDPAVVIQSIFSRWLPVSHGILAMVIQLLPNPREAQEIRVSKLWQPSVRSDQPGMNEKQKQLEDAMKSCDRNSDEVVAFVSKVFAADNTSIIGKPKQEGEASKSASVIRLEESNEKFVGFARIFSGTIKKGQKIKVMGPKWVQKYNPVEPKKYISELEVKELYLLMGRNLEQVDSVPAGNVFGIGGIEESIIKTATLSSTEYCPAFNVMTFGSSPIVRVAVESMNPQEMHRVIEGLKILNQADPCVEILVQETGEHVVVASGELHLERCLKDLRESYAKVDLRVSPPLVAFRETVTNDPSLRHRPNVKGVKTPNKLAMIKLSAIPLPENIRQFLEKNGTIIRKVFVEESSELRGETEAAAFRNQMIEEFKKAGGDWPLLLDQIWSFGPRRVGANLLINKISLGDVAEPWWTPITAKMSSEYNPKNKKKKKQEEQVQEEEEELVSQDIGSPKENVIEAVTLEEKQRLLKQYENSIMIGFQTATAAGPLCEEPMSGVCFVVEDIEFFKSNQSSIQQQYTTMGIGGLLISTMKQACRQAFLEKSDRLLEPVYNCDVQVSSEFMGKVYSVLGRRRARITNETMKENGSVLIEAILPATESFGLSEELLKSTSGAASTQLLFYGFEMLDQDPFFVATTEEELEDIGDNLGGEAPNIAKLYINNIRRRKGLSVEEKLVEKADKQRTISRNK